MATTRHSENCKIKNVKSSKVVDAVVMEFSEKKFLSVALGQAVKISMIWNGQYYEGRGAGIDFESDGPTIVKSFTGIRG